MFIQGRIQGGGDPPPKAYESNLISHDFCNSENDIRDIRPFCRPLFCHSSVVKYTPFLLQQRSRYETWLPNITEIVPPPNLTGWTWPWVHSNIIFKKTENHHARQTFMLASLLFPWPRSAPPNFLILESPLTRKFEKDLCKAPERPHVEQVRNLENLWNGIKNSNTFAFHKF